MRKHNCFFYCLQVQGPCANFHALNGYFTYFWDGLLAKFELSALTANKTCIELQADSFDI